MTGLKPALVAEYRKLLSTRLWWILLVVMGCYVAFLSGVIALSLTFDPPGPEPIPVRGEQAAVTAYSVVNGGGYVFPLVIGSLAMTTEFRHHTITQSLLVQPSRTVFLVAKLLASVPIGLLYGLIGTLGAVVAGAPVLSIQGDGAFLSSGDVLKGLVAGVAVTVLWTAIGVAFGSLLTNQVAAIVVILAFTQFVEPVARSVGGAIDAIAPVAQFFPGAAADALIGGSFYAGFGGDVDLLPRWAGLLVLLAYAVALAALARVTTLRRDLS